MTVDFLLHNHSLWLGSKFIFHYNINQNMIPVEDKKSSQNQFSICWRQWNLRLIQIQCCCHWAMCTRCSILNSSYSLKSRPGGLTNFSAMVIFSTFTSRKVEPTGLIWGGWQTITVLPPTRQSDIQSILPHSHLENSKYSFASFQIEVEDKNAVTLDIILTIRPKADIQMGVRWFL